MPTPRRKNLTEADRALWASYASRISPLPCHARAAPTGDDAPVLLAPTPRSRAMAAARSDHHQSAALAVGTHPGGVDSASWHRFRTGRLRAARTLDLHGFTAERAFRALSAFLRSAHSEGLRCVEVVTGQGGGTAPRVAALAQPAGDAPDDPWSGASARDQSRFSATTVTADAARCRSRARLTHRVR